MPIARSFVAAALALIGWFPRSAEPVFAAGGEVPEFTAPAPEADPCRSRHNGQASSIGAAPRMIPVDAPGAAVVVVKFNDYQCPPCGNTFQAYKPLKAKWDKEAPGKVKFVTKDFPLEARVQRRDSAGPHPIACEAAAAVRMARNKGKAEALEDWLFANQPTLTPGRAEAGGPRHRRRARFRRPVPEGPAGREDRHVPRRVPRRPVYADVLHQRRPDPDNRVPIMDAAIEHELRKAGVRK